MRNTVTSQGLASETDPRALLSRAFSRRGLAQPELISLTPAAVPEPYRGLLVHNSDMTSTLSRFHGDDLRLQPLHVEQQDKVWIREVLLCRISDAVPVEYGVIGISMDSFATAAQEAIRSGDVPLGRILADHSVEYVSRPSDYFRTDSNPCLDELMQDAGQGPYYGRVNSLTTPGGGMLAEVIEILPRVSI